MDQQSCEWFLQRQWEKYATSCRWPLAFCVALLLSTQIQISHALELDSIETDHLRLIYQAPTQSYLAPYVARSFESSMLLQKKVFGYESDKKVTVLLTDFSDYANASASVVPRNTIMAEVSPMSLSFETFSPVERMHAFMNHELVHIVNSDQTTERDRRFRRLFHGKVSPIAKHPESILYSLLTTPRLTAPRWYLEGIAVFMETWMAGGLGRAQGAYDEMVFRAMVYDDAHFYGRLGLVSEAVSTDFKVGALYYLYGTRFISYLAYAHSPEMVIKWVKRDEGSEADYAANFQAVFGQDLDAAWQDWIDWEHDFQQANLRFIAENPTTEFQDLATPAVGSVSRAYLNRSGTKMYAAVNYPGQVAHIAAMDLQDGSVSKITDIKHPMLYRATSLAYDEDTKTAFYTNDNYAYRDLMVVNVDTGESEMLLEDARIGELVLNPEDKSLWGIRHENGLVTLVRIAAPYAKWEQIHTWPFGEIAYDLDISPDGRLLSISHGKPDGSQSLQILSIDKLTDGDATPQASSNFGVAVPEGFVFSNDGKYLYGSSYFTGVSNIYRYEVATGDVEAVSNTEVGFFRPIPMEDGSLVVFRYTQDGLRPAKIDPKPLEDISATRFLGNLISKKHPIVRDWQVGPAADIPLEEMITYEGKYKPLSSMKFEQAYPILLGYKDETAAGIHTRFSDPIFFNSLDLDVSYSPNSDEDWHVDAKYHYLGFTAEAKYNYADFYDLFGPTEVSLKGHSIELQYDKSLVYDKPRRLDLELKASYFGDLDRVPYAQEIDAAVDEIYAVQARLDYTNVRSSLGRVDDEKGYKWNLVAGTSEVDGEYYPYVFGAFDVGFALPLNHSSIWLRTAGGTLSGDRDDPFGNFFFGGFGNNWVDHQSVKRYRDHFRFPGFDIDDFAGQSFVRPMLEWNIPPYRFRNLGTPGFYVSHARPALFTSALITNPDKSDLKNEIYNVGAQVDFELYVMSNFNMTLSVGYAVGFDDGDNHDEFMLSLKIMGSD
jgi:Tol biopolymer transport system component